MGPLRDSDIPVIIHPRHLQRSPSTQRNPYAALVGAGSS